MNQDLTPKSRQLTLRIDYKVVSIVLLVLLLGLVIYTKPWNGVQSGDARKITISGQATIKAEPDEFVFSPTWEKSTQDEITALNDVLIKGLKELGVADSQIKNNATAYEDYRVYPLEAGATESSTAESTDKPLIRQLSLTITLSDKELSQKVQDYLLTTNPQGAITPYATFSTAKQKELEDRARTEAITDARARADTTAAGLDAKIGKVLEVGENQGGCGPAGLCVGSAVPLTADASGAEARSSISLQPGESEYSYTVQVVFELK